MWQVLEADKDVSKSSAEIPDLFARKMKNGNGIAKDEQISRGALKVEGLWHTTYVEISILEDALAGAYLRCARKRGFILIIKQKNT